MEYAKLSGCGCFMHAVVAQVAKKKIRTSKNLGNDDDHFLLVLCTCFAGKNSSIFLGKMFFCESTGQNVERSWPSDKFDFRNNNNNNWQNFGVP